MTFHLVDLVSQRAAVREHLSGKSPGDILKWLAARGRVTRIPTRPGAPESYEFESVEGLRAAFFFDRDGIVFVGNHTTFV